MVLQANTNYNHPGFLHVMSLTHFYATTLRTHWWNQVKRNYATHSVSLDEPLCEPNVAKQVAVSKNDYLHSR